MNETIAKWETRAAESRRKREALRAENRRRYPWLAELVDEYREVFGEGVKVISITEERSG